MKMELKNQFGFISPINYRAFKREARAKQRDSLALAFTCELKLSKSRRFCIVADS
jgi:hypothetical protein